MAAKDKHHVRAAAVLDGTRIWARLLLVVIAFGAICNLAQAGTLATPSVAENSPLGLGRNSGAICVGVEAIQARRTHQEDAGFLGETASDDAYATRGAAEVAKHHAWPKYLGGAAKQDLVTLPRKVHEAFHSGLDKLLPRQWGAEYYQKLAPAARDQVLRDLSDYTRAFDTKHGTNIFDALVKAGFPAP